MLVLIRGAGDIATGIAMRLWRAGVQVVMTDLPQPTAIRRTVCFSQAIVLGETQVEDATARRAEDILQARRICAAGEISVLADPELRCREELRPDALVDAILAKKNLGTTRDMAPLTIALGPGFVAGQDVDAVVETKRGHRLGRIIREGSAIPNTGIPGVIGGYGAERVIHAQAAGVFMNVRKIGDFVEKGETIATIRTPEGADIPVTAQIPGILRGLLRSGYPVTPGFKIADIDPRREELSNCFLISDKSRCIAGSVLELVCAQVWQ